MRHTDDANCRHPWHDGYGYPCPIPTAEQPWLGKGTVQSKLTGKVQAYEEDDGTLIWLTREQIDAQPAIPGLPDVRFNFPAGPPQPELRKWTPQEST